MPPWFLDNLPPKRLNHSFKRAFSTIWLFQVSEKKEPGRENKDHLYGRVGSSLTLLLHNGSHKENRVLNNGRSSRVTKGILGNKAKTTAA